MVTNCLRTACWRQSRQVTVWNIDKDVNNFWGCVSDPVDDPFTFAWVNKKRKSIQVLPFCRVWIWTVLCWTVACKEDVASVSDGPPLRMLGACSAKMLKMVKWFFRLLLISSNNLSDVRQVLMRCFAVKICDDRNLPQIRRRDMETCFASEHYYLWMA